MLGWRLILFYIGQSCLTDEMLFEKKNTGSEGGCHANIKKKHVPCRENMYTDIE